MGRVLSVLWAIIEAKKLGRARAELRSQKLQEFRMGPSEGAPSPAQTELHSHGNV